MKNLNNKGFTLVETVMAVVLLGIIVIVFAPVFANILRTYYFNQSRIAASNIALNQLENLRYDIINGEYDNIGTESGNPTGLIEQEKVVSSNSKNFLVKTSIDWEDETLAGITDYDAYKKVEVNVQQINNAQAKETIGPEVSHSTLVAREGEPTINDKGSILVEARTRNSLKSDIKIEVSSDSIYQYGFTDEEGKKIFADLNPDQYDIEAGLNSLDMMFVPEAMNGSYPDIIWNPYNEITWDVDKFAKITTFFEVDWPRYLDLKLFDGNGVELDIGDYSSGLDFTLDFSITNDVTDTTSDYEIKTTLFDQSDLEELKDIKLWPRSEYNIILEDTVNSEEFNMLAEDPLQVGWNGLFADDDEAEEITIELVAAGGVEASPTPGSVSAGTNVSLSSVPGAFDIYYTTDGSVPTTSSSIYNSVITISTDTEIKAFTKKDGFLTGPVKTFVYTIN